MTENQESRDNVVLIGKKPNMAYVMAVVTQFGSGQKEVHIKARGRAISKCVDVAEIVRNKFLKDTKIKEMSIATEQVETEDHQKFGVSTMKITMMK